MIPIALLRRRLAGAAAPLFLLLATRPLDAQTPRDTVALPEVTVTATRYPVPSDSLAATLTVLHGEELRAEGIRFVSDALRQVPGVQVVQGGGYGATTSLFVRGGESDYVKVLIDGVPVNDPGGAYDFGSLTTDNVERIEILRGPASVLYGSDAITGVVQIITRRGSGSPELDASAEAGTYGTVRWEGAARGGGDGIGWSASLSRLSSDGLYAFNNQYHNTVASALLRARAGASTEATLSVRYHDAQYNFPTDFTGAPTDSNQFNTERATTLSLNLSQGFTPDFRAELLLGRNETTRGYADTLPPGQGPDAFSLSTASIQRNTADARLVYSGVRRTTLLAGVAFDDEQEQDFSLSDGTFGPFSSTFTANRHNWGVYGQATAQPDPRLQLIAGGRVDDNQRFGTFWTYRVAALGFVTPSTRLRASAGKGFKEPAFFDTFSTSPFAKGNPDLRPERSTSFEAGVEQDLARGYATLSVTGFTQKFRDLIQYSAAPPTANGPNYFNIAAANSSGIEAGATLRHLGPIDAGAYYTWVHTKVTDAGFDSGADAEFVAGQRLIRRPTSTLTLRATARPTSRLQFGSVLTYVGSRDDLLFSNIATTRVTLPSYTTVDLSSRITLVPEHHGMPGFVAQVRVENLFDKEYQQVAGYLSRGRTLLVGISSQVR
jgi:vitamin B12 transporter